MYNNYIGKVMINRSIRLMLFVLTFVPLSLFAQTKKSMTFEDILKFKYISNSVISDSGDWVAYTISMERGDPETIIKKVDDTLEYNVKQGIRPLISTNSKWCALSLIPNAIERENKEKNKLKNHLKLLNLQNGKEYEIQNVVSYEFSNDSRWLLFKLTDDNEKKSDDDKKSKKKLGFKLVLKHLESGTEILISDVTEYKIDSLNRYLFYTISDNNGKRDGIYYRDLLAEFCPEYTIYAENNFGFSNICWYAQNQVLAFLSSNLTKEGEPYRSSLWLWFGEDKMLKSIYPAELVEKNWFIPFKNNLKWNETGNILYFGMKPESERFRKEDRKIIFNDTNFYNIDTILSKVNLRIWHWNDDKIIPHQEKNWENERDKIYYAIYRMDSAKVIRLCDTFMSDIEITDNDRWTLGYSDKPYLKEITWDGWYWDMYLVNLRTGERKLINKRMQNKGYLSPNGYLVAYYKDRNWYLYDCETDMRRNLTESIDVNFWDEENDTPSEPNPYGFGGWVENDQGLYLYDMYDIWKFNSYDSSYFCMTIGIGREEEKVFRIINTEPEKKYFKFRDSLLLYCFHKKKKYRGLYLFETWVIGPKRIIEVDSLITFQVKAKFANRYLIKIEKYDLYPDLYITDNTFARFDKLSNLNLQLAKYKWGKAELIEWRNSKNESLQGYIIKPENYDSKKRYPVLIYFYERFSDRYHEFVIPRINHRPCYQIYVGAEYVMFFPDIKYGSGNPGLDATDCLVTGAQKLIDLGIADQHKIGIQGHSWGGYETAFIVTQTDMFKAAVAGAPVGNMTSAYSGIRLGSGLARQFQYEKEQSRIGGSLWDSLSNYIRNSPVFNAPNVNTPLLIMFGDVDEAVPWQQGIELYLALRRLNKNCVFLQYVNEPHHPRELHNRLDYAIKMKEFFDHYLLDKPAPDWLKTGLPYRGN